MLTGTNSDAVELPREGFDASQTTFPEFLEKIFARYVAEVKSLDDPRFPELCLKIRISMRELTDLSASIQTGVGTYLSGHSQSAYQQIATMLETLDLGPLYMILTESESSLSLSDPFSPYLHAILHPPLYRIRSDRDDFKTPDRGDIFHVPFEKRQLVGNQRYRIAGLPCLHLGSSVWICWEELGRPALDSVWVSSFRLANPVTVLDLQFPPHHVWRIFEALQVGSPSALALDSETQLKSRFCPDSLVAFILCWPLIAACSIKSESRVVVFFPEYILPQILLQWAMTQGAVDGIRYFSSRMPSNGLHLIAHSNCVFPVRVSSARGHCNHLRKLFALTEPVSWELLSATNFGEGNRVDSSPNRFAFIQMNKDLSLGYSQTHFASIESKLAEIESRPGCSRPLDS